MKLLIYQNSQLDFGGGLCLSYTFINSTFPGPKGPLVISLYCTDQLGNCLFHVYAVIGMGARKLILTR